MKCAICKKQRDEVIIYEGIKDVEMIWVCETCAQSEGIPIIKKPSQEQLERAIQTHSVRERMEKLSGLQTQKREKPLALHGDLAKLRMPKKKQYHQDILDNYYWEINMARRRKKLSFLQLSEMTSIPQDILEEIEKGQLPERVVDVFEKLEIALGIQILKDRKQKIMFSRNEDKEKMILEQVKRKMQPKEGKKSNIENDFSRRDKLEDITISDLVERKKLREKNSLKNDDFLGDEIELDKEEL